MSVTNINKADMNQQPNDKQTICIVIPCYNEEEVSAVGNGETADHDRQDEG